MTLTTFPLRFDRAAVRERFRQARARTRGLFDILDDSWYYQRPIALRNPVVFYEGHIPAFAINTLIKKGLGGTGVDPHLEQVFARGIDPESEATAVARGNPAWPSRDAVNEYVAAADRLIEDAIMTGELERDDHPLLRRAEALWTILEHEEMHQETLLYMWHRLPFDAKRAPAGYRPSTEGRPPSQEWMDVPGGRATMGVARGAIAFGWDNEHPACEEDVAPFAIDRHDVTNARFLEFVEAGGYRNRSWWRDEDWAWRQREGLEHPLFWEQEDGRWCWRGLFERVPLPLAWPVYVSQAEATAFARWADARLPTEAEYQRAAYGSPDGERPRPWGEDGGADAGAFDFVSWDPVPAGTHPRGASAWGVEDLVGNGWEWTSTPFAPFPGFRASPSYPEYSADFFDGEHFVMKGASPATAAGLVRPTFRNWFRARYPYVYATFRCVRTHPGQARA